MTEITVSARIKSFIEGRFPQGGIETDKDIFSLGYINSLFAMELVMFIEKTFSITVPNEELRIDNFRTIDAMSALVERVRSAAMVG
jgi:methoxymalonate biosynthesis acyl carrier protein